jgi:hypothetical protein
MLADHQHALRALPSAAVEQQAHPVERNTHPVQKIHPAQKVYLVV